MLSKPTQIIKNALLIVLLCLLAFSAACSAPKAAGSYENDAPEIAAAVPEAQTGEDALVSSVFDSSGAKTEYTLGEAFDETGLSLTLQYSSGRTDTITSGFSSDLDTSAPGEQDIHIQYQGSEVGQLHITVLPGADTGYDDTAQADPGADSSNESEQASQAASDTDWTQVYGQFLSAYASSLSRIDSTDCYALHDITGDGIPELFLNQQSEPGSPFYASFIYTVSGGSAAALGQVPENTFALCPADGNDFLSVMQHMFCETVVLYTYEDGALHEQTLLYEVPVDQLPKNASTPLDEMGTMSSHGSAPTRSTIFPVCPSPAFRPAPMRILSLCSKQKRALPEFLCKTRVCLQQSPAPRGSRALLWY